MQTYSLNKVILIGRLGANPVGRSTKKGQSTCSFSIATNEKWKNKQGGWNEHVEWHSIVAWGALADFASSSLKKGQMVQLITSTAGMDPKMYNNPEVFDIKRDHDKSISFGQGPHYCIGVTLVRSQTEVMLRELFNRFPNLSLTGDVQYDYDHHNARRMTELTVKTNI